MNYLISKLSFNKIALIVTLLFLVIKSLFYLDCAIYYKYHIDQNFDQSVMYQTFKAAKTEIDIVMGQLIITFAYIIFMLIYIIYHMYSENNKNVNEPK